ncbi:hypothetical protein [Burkholderia stabilis]|uniref:hypothetical protein n=1 Tax=Burkholderia stabilis TaxID=95485 RepID=UPI00114729D4|nr:hypothetical protein [Burkholderia stabilis]
MKIKSADEFKVYAESENANEFAKVYEESTDEVWVEVLLKYPALSRLVAANNTNSMNVMNYLSRSGDWMTRCDVATKRRISREIFERLASDVHPGVRQAIACNPKVPEDILAGLVDDVDNLVAEAAKERLRL